MLALIYSLSSTILIMFGWIFLIRLIFKLLLHRKMF